MKLLSYFGKKTKFILLFIIILAAFLRFFQLGTNPPSLTWDEVAWGYNAYSIGIDGRDEFGRFLPYEYLESFGDFKPPVYVYLDILPIKIFGLTEFATRFPSAFFGVLTVLVTYFLVKAIFPDRDNSKNKKKNYVEAIALVSAFLLAISPWHLMLSRGAFEANIGTFFIALGVWLFLEAIQRRPSLLILSAISFVLTIYTFNSTRIVAPLIVLALAILFWRQLLKIKKAVITATIVALVLVLPTIPFLFSPQAKLRFVEVNIFSDIKVIEMANQEIINDNYAWWSKILHNRRVEYGMSYLSHYFDHFSFDFLFIHGDGNPKFSTHSVGQLYFWEFPFLIAGLLFLFKKREGNWKLIPLWILLAIIPAATARETPHALRIEGVLPMAQILVAYGIVSLFYCFANAKLSKVNRLFVKLFTVCYLLFAFLSITYYFEDYYNHYAKQFSYDWQYGYKEAVQYSMDVRDEYEAIYLTDIFGRPYIYTLFYGRYDPKDFRKEARVQRETVGFVNVLGVDKFYFDRSLIPDDKVKKTLYIDVPKDVIGGGTVKKKFYFLDGSVALVAYTL
jgi:4-amino-4-deoxy-L-arabinose transferase-like glycosyltransferase